jgi:hypothetical protein
MAQTLAESFLADLDELSDDEHVQEEEDKMDVDADAGQGEVSGLVQLHGCCR